MKKNEKFQRPSWWILTEGLMGYLLIIVIGRLTNFFSKEYATTLVGYLIPIALFIGGAMAINTILNHLLK